MDKVFDLPDKNAGVGDFMLHNFRHSAFFTTFIPMRGSSLHGHETVVSMRGILHKEFMTPSEKNSIADAESVDGIPRSFIASYLGISSQRIKRICREKRQNYHWHEDAVRPKKLDDISYTSVFLFGGWEEYIGQEPANTVSFC